MSHTGSATVASKTPYRVRQPRARSRLSNGTRGMVLPGIDQRSAIARRYRDVICAIIADLGGESRLSEARLQLIRRFSALGRAGGNDGGGAGRWQTVRQQRARAHFIHSRAPCGTCRVPKNVTPSLHDYLESKVAEREAAE